MPYNKKKQKMIKLALQLSKKIEYINYTKKILNILVMKNKFKPVVVNHPQI